MLPKTQLRSNQSASLVLAAIAAFCTYFCMYAFRKPFSAGFYEGQEIWGFGLKSLLVISQLLGYMLAKFLGIKFVSEMPAGGRAASIVILIATAEIALIGFAWLPPTLKIGMLFLNGLSLGMIFGLVLAYLEGRRVTEALSAVLCASFIVSSGAVKSLGRWLVEYWQVTEFSMPMVVGLLFLIPTAISVWFLSQTPPPDEEDLRLRSKRDTMNGLQRREFLSNYWFGIALLTAIYVILTILRTVRDDFGVELWRDMGVSEKPEVFVTSETIVACVVMTLAALAVWIKDNWLAMKATIAVCCAAFGLIIFASWGQPGGLMGPMTFMVVCGVGLYIPYVAFHTSLFERLLAASKKPANIGFLMYFADAIGYLGYAAVLIVKSGVDNSQELLPSFLTLLFGGSVLSIVAFLLATVYFHRKFLPATADAITETQE